MPTSSRSAGSESEVVTRWPLVWLVGGLTLGFVVIPLVCAMLRSNPDPVPERTVQVKQPAPERVRERALLAFEEARSAISVPEAAADLEPTPPSVVAAPAPGPETIAVVPRELPPDPAAARAAERPVVTRMPAADPIAAAPASSQSGLGESSLRELLKAEAVTIGLERTKNARNTLLELGRPAKPDPAVKQPVNARDRNATQSKHVVLEWAAEQREFAALPFREAKDCQLDQQATGSIEQVSRQFRRLRFRRGGTPGGSFSTYHDPSSAIVSTLISDAKLPRDENVPGLVQILQAEEAHVRRQLVAVLSGVTGPKATEALAQRALFDFAPEVREAAVKALQNRPRPEVRRPLVAGLRYPWAPVAGHAADALAALQDVEAVPELIALLDLPSPTTPFRDDKDRLVVRELVRVNHLHNCLLCHAVAQDPRDRVRGLIPEPGTPIPVEYYESSKGDFVRADVTYLKQDFSLMEPVADYGKWPVVQRHDYLVRTRSVSKWEALAAWSAEGRDDARLYPQKEAVLTALRALTKADAGTRAEQWRAWLKESRAELQK